MKRAVDWLDGTFDVQHRLDRGLKNGFNARAFTGTILKREKIGKTSGDPVED